MTPMQPPTFHQPPPYVTLRWPAVCLLVSWLCLMLNHDTSQAADAPSIERILITHDNCPDVTWGWTETQTRQAFADLVVSHLDEMARTDDGPPESRDHFNLATTQEALDFVAHYPARKEEFIRRIREGRICVSPFLCNSLWGFQSVEGALRTLYPARRLERAWNIRLDVAEHIELPSLPWGLASLLAGSGVRWVSNPFLNYDCTFRNLRNPPLFRWTGPDGSEVRVIMDNWACLRAHYSQGAFLLKEPSRIIQEWLPHYRQLGAAYPLPTILASGTHSDISPASGKQTRGFADALRQYNAAGTNPVRLVNGTLAQFCAEADAEESRRPFLPVLRGCFGHAWELWPISLAGTVAELRTQERSFLAAESLVALASLERREIAATTRIAREQAEWFLAMLSDHAWNGTNRENKRHNAELRRNWARNLGEINRELIRQAWEDLDFKADKHFVTVFNPLSFTNDVVVTCEAPAFVRSVMCLDQPLPAQFTDSESGRRVTFVARAIPPFGFREFALISSLRDPGPIPFQTGQAEMTGPFYRLRLAEDGSGIASLVHRASGEELVKISGKRCLGQAEFFDGLEHTWEKGAVTVADDGPVFASLRITGELGPIRLTNTVTLYAGLDRVDLEVQLEKPPSTNEQRLLHFFPFGGGPRDCHLETTGAVLCPATQPEGDLLPGADDRRFAVQGFLDVSPARSRVGVTVAPLDPFFVRMDRGAPAFELLGNDQNWKEVTQDQHGVRNFRFRYRLRAHDAGYQNATAMAWSRAVLTPVVYARGRLPGHWLNRPLMGVDPARAVVTCLKPADDPRDTGLVLRVWETAGLDSPVPLVIPEARRLRTTDLLERPLDSFRPVQDVIQLHLRAHGFAALQWEGSPLSLRLR
jgi:hypothetical protein